MGDRKTKLVQPPKAFCRSLGRLGDRGGEEARFAHRVAKLTINSITTAISRDWTRTQRDVSTMDDGHFCTDWSLVARFRLTDLSKQVHHSDRTIPATFCDIDGEPPEDPLATDSRTLNFRIIALKIHEAAKKDGRKRGHK